MTFARSDVRAYHKTHTDLEAFVSKSAEPEYSDEWVINAIAGELLYEFRDGAPWDEARALTKAIRLRHGAPRTSSLLDQARIRMNELRRELGWTEI